MHLDPEQRAVLELAAGGLTSDEVAVRLGQAPEEVRRRLEGAIAALGVESRLEAVAIALRLGLIDQPWA